MRPLNILIVGCGYVGMAVGSALARRGDTVTGICRTAESFADLQREGIRAVLADVTSPQSLARIRPDFDAVVDCVSSGRQGLDAYRAVYLKGTINLVEWAEASPPGITIFAGSTTVYSQTNAERVEETSPTEPPHDSGKILIEAEHLLLESKLPVAILRLAGIYGPGRHAMLDKLRNGATVLPGDGSPYLNMIHRDDIVQAILATIDRAPSGEVFNVVDDEPVTEADYVGWICEQLKLPMVRFDPAAQRKFKGSMRKDFQPNRRISNARLKKELGIALRYPTFREGLKPLLERGEK